MIKFFSYSKRFFILFHLECLVFPLAGRNIINKRVSFVNSMDEFKINFDRHFKLNDWFDAIDFKKFHISGGSLVGSLCREPIRSPNAEPIDINFNGSSLATFEHEVMVTLAHLESVTSKTDSINPQLTKKTNGVYDIKLSFNIILRFHFKDIPENKDPISHVLYGSDIDLSQVAFTGCLRKKISM